ncbi:hypothetical protein [Rhodococcus qingshengii]|uniref:hypothetical protein n=1 Tax=Rhodococcus qingshengii TaxID=334542 RepID=UPI002942E6E5|nr:hypothetical protein [Rhodococcus qingshengii]WOI85963.1 hypothetical protein R0122_22555 [Rhodococcus qingshengii]
MAATHFAELLPNINKPRDTTPFVRREHHKENIGDLPPEVVDLVDNKAYLNRHRKLQREHGDKILRAVAEMSRAKGIGLPSHFYAKLTSLKKWDETLVTVTKLLRATRHAKILIDKLGADPSWLFWYVGVCFKHSEAKVAGWLERAQRGRSRPKLFAWLVVNDKPKEVI